MALKWEVSYQDSLYDKITVKIVVFADDESEARKMARDMLWYNGYATPRLTYLGIIRNPDMSRFEREDE